MFSRHRGLFKYARVDGSREAWGKLGLALCVVVGVAALGACSISTATATAKAVASPEATKTARPSPIVSGVPALAVLADKVQGALGLWHFDLAAGWTTIGSTPDATAIGRFDDRLVLARAGSLEVRGLGTPAQPGATTTASWKSDPPAAPIVSVDRSPTGSTAFACSNDKGQTYGLIGLDGVASRLNPGPTAAFMPQVAWLDSTRLLVLNTDAALLSRLSVFDVEASNVRDLMGVSGIRTFAVSGDRKTVVAVTQDKVYVGTSAEWLGGAAPSAIVTLSPSQVVWAPALDSTGVRLAMLSGKVAADGTVTDIHEFVYAKEGGGWTVKSDLAVPFTHAVGQVWLT